MQKIKIRLPATITNLGPGLNSLGLAVGLYATVEISGRNDQTLNVDLSGEGADDFDTPLRHPAVIALARFFQRIERAVLGINITVDNQIPLNSGLGAETAFTIAGVLGANNLLGDPYKRYELLEIAASFGRPDAVVAALLGGLGAGILDDSGEHLVHRALPVMPFKVIVVLPEMKDYSPPVLPEQLPRRDAIYNLSRLPILVDMLRQGELEQLSHILNDRLYAPRLRPRITGFDDVAQVARRNGALGVATSGDGPAVVAFAKRGYDHIAEEMVLAFQNAGADARSWVLPVDTQGVVISAVHSA